jgi:hypothetical protein
VKESGFFRESTLFDVLSICIEYSGEFLDRSGEMEKWTYYSPVFDVDTHNAGIRAGSAWGGHTRFAYDLVRFMKPEILVELGTYHGASFFSFCQAVKDEDLKTKCFAVDTWEGDGHSGFYDNRIFEEVSTVRDTHFTTMATLIRSTFDEALPSFEDETIDVLHIDGYHTYEAVSHDYTTWLPKLKKEGVILFHDIAVKDRGFGVYQLWEELTNQYPHFAFGHSYGLGVLFPKGYNKKFEHVFEQVAELQQKYG